ncbi:hypothetical protein [Salinibacter pepae]|uniref:hypothetical protein n=1 Tax=Salinibacter pepae TaxID=3040382 RepID=UPI0021E90C5E|nr:hypothetical protein [Salinibacter pepae]
MSKKSPEDREVDHRTETDGEGVHHYRTYEDENGDQYTQYEGTESRNELLGFEDDEHFEDNML